MSSSTFLMRSTGPKPTSTAHRARASFSPSEPIGDRRADSPLAGQAPRITQNVPTGADRHHDSWPEGLEVERGQVQLAPDLGVGGIEQLKAAVEQQAVSPIGAHPTAGSVGGLEQQHVEARTG